MDIDAVHSTLLSLTLLPEQLREARTELSQSGAPAQDALSELLGSIERDLRVAKAALARELGFPLCDCCWPPELLVTESGASSCRARTIAQRSATGLPDGSSKVIELRERQVQIAVAV